jgi:hypothetical protein
MAKQKTTAPKMTAREARARRTKIEADRRAWEALRSRALDAGDDVGHINAIIRDKHESEVRLSNLEAIAVLEGRL